MNSEYTTKELDSLIFEKTRRLKVLQEKIEQIKKELH